MRARRNSAEPPGHDSFLDIVANLVGILIILVIVIGAQAADAMIEQTSEEIDVEGPKSAARSVESDIHALSGRISRQDFEIDYRRKERARMHFALTSIEKKITDKQQNLGEAQRQRVQLLQQTRDMQSQLKQVRQAKFAIQNSKPNTKVIEHMPTPMAKTVFGKELHFRLSHGRIAYIPWDALVERLKKEAPQKTWKLKNSAELTETIGPLQDFWLNYTLQRTTMRVANGSGYSMQQGMRLHHFTVVPVREELGERVEDALMRNSSFRARIGTHDPNQTTVTIWVYPDSFHHFRKVKEALFKIDFLCAGRPLPEGFPIGGAPDGSRSVAQ